MNSFIKNKEDFECENCGENVEGSGYTNHCPKCLWSKHVDIDPGDRAAECSGLMEPTEVSKEGDTFSITHKCVACGYSKKNKISPDDDFNLVVKLASDAPLP